ncbi:lamin tail domain-containing protein [Archangium sp.]|jgi:beta-lactamase superfamily II metal-dependent hydrolase/chitodextrinase|uniref:lamin tail domain-containing protein n=1 Tax=Archangium sp. TaxID=1872627 RepID=UPI002EDA70D2
MLSRLKTVLNSLLLLTLLLPTWAWSQGLRFTTLDIGQGDSAVLIAPGGCVALFDGGPTGSGTTIKAYLKALGVTRIDMAFVSHMHADHMGGIDEVDVGTNAIPIDAVYDHGGTYNSTAYDEYVSHFSGRRATATRGQTLSLCGQVTLTVVAVNGNGVASTDENTKSVTVKVSYGAFDALVGGDLTGTPDVESTILNTVGELELYKVHHHGSRSSSNDSLLDVTNPTVSFISVGKDNTYGHPTPECLDRLTAHNSAIWQTEDPATNSKRGHIELSSPDGNTFVVAQGTRSVGYTSKGATPPGPDTQAPTAPGALVASAVSSTEVDLSWNASTDNVGVTGYRVYRSTNGSGYSLAGTSTSTGFADLGLTPGTPYAYQVTAVDAAGNESTPSSASTRTPAPGITLTSPNGGESWAGGSARAITWTAQDISNVKLEYSLDNGATWRVIASSVAASTGSYTWTVVNSATTAARVRATDAFGSASDLSNGTFTITAVATPAKVILNEILANEPGALTDGEFVELVNVGGVAIDISGWVVLDATSVRHTFPAGTVLGAGKALVVFGGASGIPTGTPGAVVASTGTLSLNNGGDTVTVKTSSAKSATTIDSFTYGSSLAGQDGVSMNRGPDASATGGFVLHTGLSSLSASPGERVNGTAF